MIKATAIYMASAIMFTSTAAGMMTAGVAFAAAPPPVSTTEPPPAARATLAPDMPTKDMNESSFVLGRIGVAQIALIHGLKGEAQAGIESALDTSSGLNSRQAHFSPEAPVALGRLSYKTVSGKKEFYIPVVNRVFPAQVLDDKMLRKSAPDVEMTDAQIVHAHVLLQGTVLHAGLLQAEAALRAGRQDDAMTYLSAIVGGAVKEVAAPVPLTVDTARDNLQLAALLLKDKSFKAASFAVDHARQAVVSAGSADAVLQGKKADVSRLVQGLGDLGFAIKSGAYATTPAPKDTVSGLEKQLDSLSPNG